MFVRATGDEGRYWVARYSEPPCSTLRADSRRALELLRQHRIPEGRALLNEVRRASESLARECPSRFHVVRRGHATVRAYIHYLEGDLDAATAYLEQAQEHTEAAISRHPILMPLAEMSPELHFQHIRIARRRRDWHAMGRRVDRLRAVIEDRMPLCRLEDGTEIHFQTLRSFLDGLDGLPPGARESFEEVLDPRIRRRRSERAIREIYALSGFVIANS